VIGVTIRLSQGELTKAAQHLFRIRRPCVSGPAAGCLCVRQQQYGVLYLPACLPACVASLLNFLWYFAQGKPVRVKLHVSSGRLADGTIGLEGLVDGEVAQLVVQAEG